MVPLNLLGNSYFNEGISWGGLMFFALFSIIFISFLRIFYRKISKSNNKMSGTPIYNQSKDILLQDKKIEGIYFEQTKSLSIWAKLTIYLLIVIAITTPLYQLFGIQHFI